VPLCCLEYKHTDVRPVGEMKSPEVIDQTAIIELCFRLFNPLDLDKHILQVRVKICWKRAGLQAPSLFAEQHRSKIL